MDDETVARQEGVNVTVSLEDHLGARQLWLKRYSHQLSLLITKYICVCDMDQRMWTSWTPGQCIETQTLEISDFAAIALEGHT